MNRGGGRGPLSPPRTAKVKCIFLSHCLHCWMYAGTFPTSCTWVHTMAGSSCSSRPIAEINNVTTHIKRNYNITGKFLVPENVQGKHVSTNLKQIDAEM